MTELPRWSAYAALVYLAGAVIPLVLGPAHLANIANDLLVAAATVPFEIAVYRFLLLAEVHPERSRKRRRGRFWRFLTASLLVSLPLSLLSVLSVSDMPPVVAVIGAAAPVICLVLVATWFPALAAENRVPAFRDALQEACRILFRLLGACGIVLLYVFVPAIAIVGFFPLTEPFVLAMFTFVVAAAWMSISAQALRWTREVHGIDTKASRAKPLSRA